MCVYIYIYMYSQVAKRAVTRVGDLGLKKSIAGLFAAKGRGPARLTVYIYIYTHRDMCIYIYICSIHNNTIRVYS